jgi:dipeptidyl aminopeptidase/acylaminoacyl peptidase
LVELARQGLVDPSRACIVGASYGGYAALAGVTLQQGIYRCAVSVAGISDPELFMSRLRDRVGRLALDYWLRFLGARSLSDARIDARSPARHAARADAPVLLIHGREDTVVPIEQSRVMERALKDAGKPVEMIALDGEDHYLSREATRVAMLRATLEFVQRHNPINPAGASGSSGTAP